MPLGGLTGRIRTSYKAKVLLLSLAQSLYVLSASANAMFTALVGAMLAPKASLATLPMSILMLGTLMTTLPLSLLMRRKGRRAGFMVGAGAGVLFAIIALISLYERSFWAFCLAALIHGVYQAGAMYYRYAALEVSPVHFQGRAVSYVIGGGLLAAVVAPYLFSGANALMEPLTFGGVYAAMTCISLGAMALLTVIPFPPPAAAAIGDEPARPMSEILGSPIVAAAVVTVAMAYALMMLLMTAAPLAMVGCGLSVTVASTAISWHMVAMFLPSFFSGRLVDRWGAPRVLMAGIVIFAVAAIAAAAGLSVFHFKVTLLGAGAGWNLMLTAGTVMLASGYRPSEQAKVQGMNEVVAFSASALASFAAGVFIGQASWLVVAAVTLGLALATAMATGLLLIKEKKAAVI